MNSKKMLGTLVVSAALIAPASVLIAPAQATVFSQEAPAAQQIDGTGSASGSASYAGDALKFLTCLLGGSFTGSKYPLC
ncbi:hypothetical protein AB0N05_32960 [Nocardia sp. NPDC051030]|uniref:hypothetical protein n=1 Tax=Nocardia sp. NPDC051030 TaxID=3155162 RepID=UPI00343B0E0B